MNSYLFDTQALIWYFTGKGSLSPKAKKCLDEVFTFKSQGAVSIITLFEIYHFALKRPKFNFPVFLSWLVKYRFEILPVDKEVFLKAISLPRFLEIHDRIIVATSILKNAVLVSKDKEILGLPNVKVIW